MEGEREKEGDEERDGGKMRSGVEWRWTPGGRSRG